MEPTWLLVRFCRYGRCRVLRRRGVNARAFQITYRGGDGNDVILTSLAQLSLAIAPASLSEKNGVATATLSRIGADTSSSLTVSLLSSDTSEATVPSTVVITSRRRFCHIQCYRH